MAHIALKSFKYQAADGTMKHASPGETLHEAANWKNRDMLIRRRWITMDNGEPFDNRHYRVPKPGMPPKAQAKPKAPAKPIEKPVEKPVEETKVEQAPPTIKDPTPAPETKADTQALIRDLTKMEPKGPKYTKEELKSLLKIELQVIATDLGIKGETKEQMINGILEKQEES